MVKKVKSFLKRWWNEDSNNNPNLKQLKSFKLSYGLPFLIAIVLAGVIIYGERMWEKELCLASECFYFLYESFKIPLWIAAIALPLTGLVASNHRSEQTAKQIKLMSNQNSFSNYWKHIEVFEERFNDYSVLDPFEKRVKVEFKDLRKLYETVFDRNFPYDFDVVYRGDHETGIEIALGCIQEIMPVKGVCLNEGLIDGKYCDFYNLFHLLNIKRVSVDDVAFDIDEHCSGHVCEFDICSPIVFWACVDVVLNLCSFASAPMKKGERILRYDYDSGSQIFRLDFFGVDFKECYNVFKNIC